MSKVEIKVLGGGKEIGRNAILIEGKENRVLLEYGVSVGEEKPGFPLHVRPKDIDLVLLTHAHLDHCGGIPLLYVSRDIPLYTTKLTGSISEILILDFLKISKYYVPYESLELQRMLSNVKDIENDETKDTSGVKVRAFNSGHIPGSTAFKVSVDSKTVFYTGDFNLKDSCLLKGANFNDVKADIIISEGTYALYNHPKRDEVEKRFVAAIEEVLDNEGTVLIPAFSVGRSQEIICVLKKRGLDKYPIYLDGMSRRISELLLHNKKYLRDSKLYKKAYSSCIKVRSSRDRKKVLKEPSIIISSAGMLKGGPAVHYFERLMENERNGVFFVSFQASDTPGREVLESGTYTLGNSNKVKKVNARIEWFDFSSHVGRDELIEFLVKAGKRAESTIIIHTSEEGGNFLAKKVEEKIGYRPIVPDNGQSISI